MTQPTSIPNSSPTAKATATPPRKIARASKRPRGRPRSDIIKARTCWTLPLRIVKRLSDYAYWQRKTASQVVTEALVAYLSNKRIKPKPKDTSGSLIRDTLKKWAGYKKGELTN